MVYWAGPVPPRRKNKEVRVFWLIVAVLLGILIGLLLAWWLFLGRKEPPAPPLPSPPPGSFKIPDQYTPAALSSAFQARLAGMPANGAAPVSAATPAKVVWVDAGDEVVAHLDSVQVKILDRLVLISIDLESDQTGRTPLIVSFALGNAGDPAGLVAVTDEFPHGDGRLVSRWGEAVQAALWSTLLGIAQDHATERGKAPAGISSAPGTLTLHADKPIGVTA
jgi:hypothetical protein